MHPTRPRITACQFMLGRRARLLLSLYVSQYVGMAFVFAAVPVIARERGMALDQVAVFYSLAMIWTLKFLWAPFVDRYRIGRGPRYRGWIILSQLVLAAATLAASAFDPVAHRGWLALCVGGMCLASSVQDVAADAVAVRMLRPDERGLGNAVQTAGGLIGALIGAGGVVVLYDHAGWQVSLWALAAMTLLPLPLILRMTASEVTQERAPGLGATLRVLRQPGMPMWLLVLTAAQFGLDGQVALINPLLVDRGWTLSRIAASTTVWGALFGVIGAGLGALIWRGLPRRAAIAAALLATAALDLPIALRHDLARTDTALLVLLALFYCGWGLSSTVLASAMMERCRTRTAAGDYAAQFSIGAIAGLGGAGLMLALGQARGYGASFALGVGMLLAAALLLLREVAPPPVELRPDDS